MPYIYIMNQKLSYGGTACQPETQNAKLPQPHHPPEPPHCHHACCDHAPSRLQGFPIHNRTGHNRTGCLRCWNPDNKKKQKTPSSLSRTTWKGCYITNYITSKSNKPGPKPAPKCWNLSQEEQRLDHHMEVVLEVALSQLSSKGDCVPTMTFKQAPVSRSTVFQQSN